MNRADRQVQAIVALIDALPDKRRAEVLQRVTPPSTDGPRHRGKPCATCGLIYPKHISVWGADDHPFEVSNRG